MCHYMRSYANLSIKLNQNQEKTTKNENLFKSKILSKRRNKKKGKAEKWKNRRKPDKIRVNSLLT